MTEFEVKTLGEGTWPREYREGVDGELIDVTGFTGANPELPVYQVRSIRVPKFAYPVVKWLTWRWLESAVFDDQAAIIELRRRV